MAKQLEQRSWWMENERVVFAEVTGATCATVTLPRGDVSWVRTDDGRVRMIANCDLFKLPRDRDPQRDR